MGALHHARQPNQDAEDASRSQGGPAFPSREQQEQRHEIETHGGVPAQEGASPSRRAGDERRLELPKPPENGEVGGPGASPQALADGVDDDAGADSHDEHQEQGRITVLAPAGRGEGGAQDEHRPDGGGDAREGSPVVKEVPGLAFAERPVSPGCAREVEGGLEPDVQPRKAEEQGQGHGATESQPQRRPSGRLVLFDCHTDDSILPEDLGPGG